MQQWGVFMKIVIAGAGKVGNALTAQLSEEGHDLTLIDTKGNVLENTMDKFDVITVTGNCASASVLQEASIEDADLLIAATNADEVNLLSCITAHAMNKDVHAIARIRNPEYVDQAYAMRDDFALSLVLNPEKQAAAEIANLVKYPGFLKRDTFAKARVNIVEIQASEGSKIIGQPLSKIPGLLHCQILICAVERGDQVYIPSGDFVLEEGDRIYVTATSSNLHKLLFSLGILKREIKRVLILGGGRISLYLGQEFERTGIDTTIVEIDEEKCEQLTEALPLTTIIHGDASSAQFLDAENMSLYDAVISATGMDELNLVISMSANVSGVPLCITKLGRGENMKMMENLSIGPMVCPKDLCTMHIVRYVRAMQEEGGAAITIHQIANGKAEVMEFVVDENTKHQNEAFKTLHMKKNTLIVCVGHGNQTTIANGYCSYNLGDTVIVVTSDRNAVRNLNDLFEE